MIYERVANYEKEASKTLESLKNLDSKAHQDLLVLKKELSGSRGHYKLV